MSEVIKKVGSYRLTKRIGSGATSQVFQAYKQGQHQKYAIKMIRLKSISMNQKQMIQKQISIIKSISHPFIVKLYDTLQTPNNYYLIFEYCQKGDLQKYLKQYYGPLIPQQTVQKIIFSIGDAIEEIHSKGIVHRDIKLANVLLKKDLTIKLADFGFAKEVHDQQFMMKTYCGTPITMAPEILMNKEYDKKCDIWSLGIIIFQLIYGKLPFPINQGYNKFVQKVIKQPLNIPLQPQMPLQFKQILERCLSKSPQNRCSIVQFMHSEWILQGKDKKLQQRKKQNWAHMSQLLKDISPIDKQQQKHESNIILELNTSQKLYTFVKNQLDKIIQYHLEVRNILMDKLVSAKNNPNYLIMINLLMYFDNKYIKFLTQLKIKVTVDNHQQYITIRDVTGVQIPIQLYILKKQLADQVKFNDKVQIHKGQVFQNFLKQQKQIEYTNEYLQKKKQRYIIVQQFTTLLRSYDLQLTIIFGHHFYHQQISLQNVLIQFKQMGKQISETNIKQNVQDNQEKRTSEKEDKHIKYDKNSNFITISMQYKERNQKVRQFRDAIKLNCEKMIDQITKTIQGYYN